MTRTIERTEPFTIKAQKDLARRVSYSLDYLGNQSSTVSTLLTRALESCETEERGHRAMGARFTSGQAKYRLPVQVSARLMVGRSFFCEAEAYSSWDPVSRTAQEALAVVATLRDDHQACALAYSVVDPQHLAAATSRLEAGWSLLRVVSPGQLTVAPGGVAYRYLTAQGVLNEWDYALDCAVRS